MSEASHQSSSSHEARLAATARIVGAAIALAGVTAPSAQAETHPVGGAEAITQTHPEYGSTNAEIPSKVEALMRHDTVYFPNPGCSGKALRNPKGEVVGAVTAQHCGLMSADTERIWGTDGNFYIIQKKPIVARTGAIRSKLKTVAKIDRFIVPADGDNTIDVAIGVAKGHTPEEAAKSYEDSKLSVEEVQQLSAGQNVFMSGWPQYQPKNKQPIMERQAFKTSIIGIGYSGSNKTHDVKTLWTSTTATKAGATCSYGASGSEGFVMIDGKPKSVGVLTYFNDLNGKVPGDYNPASPSLPDLHLKGTSTKAVCGFAFESPRLGKNAMVVRSVRSAAEIPGYVTPEQSISAAKKRLKNPAYTRTELDGLLTIPLQKGGPSSFGAYVEVISNPIIEHDPKAGATIIFFADPENPDHLDSRYLKDTALDMLTLYPHDMDSTQLPSLVTSSGALDFVSDPTEATNGSLNDTKLGKVGARYANKSDVHGLNYTLELVDGKYQVAVPQMK